MPLKFKPVVGVLTSRCDLRRGDKFTIETASKVWTRTDAPANSSYAAIDDSFVHTNLFSDSRYYTQVSERGQYIRVLASGHFFMKLPGLNDKEVYMRTDNFATFQSGTVSTIACVQMTGVNAGRLSSFDGNQLVVQVELWADTEPG